MAHHADVGRGRDIVARWCNLAEQRLDHLTELFETGRWRRYHSEQAFLENIREARAAVEIWRDLEMREATRANAALDLAWLGRPRTNLPRVDALPASVQRLQPLSARIPAEPLSHDVPADVLAALESVLVGTAETPAAPDAPDPAELSPASHDLDVMQQRYPLLRNAL